jgi:hypothetical protein
MKKDGSLGERQWQWQNSIFFFEKKIERHYWE